jgi:hypothetical protein
MGTSLLQNGRECPQQYLHIHPQAAAFNISDVQMHTVVKF